ncbi:hypothetical protein CQA53_11635 [Helicobacter didelphidarum]|uniref:Uncharacterized protein n=1 Tax=Helicobacter didelphidarum TaxID=2040648 RepID=A0A3D8I1Z0_9HELI|nr:hypothetical protein [Helicobacter didelphidarum]RDU59105.1 hypothetical protein CQA53_11635 [Helicobacter didelphidarum]
MSEIIKDNDRESQKDKANADSTKLDSDDDKIIWELKHKKTLGFFYSWFVRYIFFFGGIYYIIIGTQKYLSRDDNGLLISVILLFLVILWFFVSPLLIYKTLNARKILIKNNNLILKKYIGKDINLPLGTFFIDIRNPTWFAALLVCDDVEIVNFHGKSIYTLQLIEDNIENLNQLYVVLNPYINDFLYSLDKDNYHKAYNILLPITQNFHSNLYKDKNRQFNLNKIERLRKEQENAM